MRISVIIPAYKVEKYLQKCVDSVLAQTFTDFELLLVDDGSPDGSAEMCDENALSDDRIIVIHKKNEGVSTARNCGLDLIKEEYITFVDGDDFLFREALEEYLLHLENVDMSILGFATIKDDDHIVSCMEGDISTHTISNDEALKILFSEAGETFDIPFQYGYQGYIWNKAFKTQIIQHYLLRFDKDCKYNEDRLFLVKYLVRASKISIQNKLIYAYRMTDGAMWQLQNINESNIKSLLTEMIAYEKMALELLDYKPEFFEICEFSMYKKYLEWYQTSYLKIPQMRQRLFERIKYHARILEMISDDKFLINENEAKKTIRKIIIRKKIWNIKNFCKSIIKYPMLCLKRRSIS